LLFAVDIRRFETTGSTTENLTIDFVPIGIRRKFNAHADVESALAALVAHEIPVLVIERVAGGMLPGKRNSTERACSEYAIDLVGDL
jgi:hypothetical protein